MLAGDRSSFAKGNLYWQLDTLVGLVPASESMNLDFVDCTGRPVLAKQRSRSYLIHDVRHVGGRNIYERMSPTSSYPIVNSVAMGGYPARAV